MIVLEKYNYYSKDNLYKCFIVPSGEMAIDLMNYFNKRVALVHNTGRFVTTGTVLRTVEANDHLYTLESAQTILVNVTNTYNLNDLIRMFGVKDSKDSCAIDSRDYSLVQDITERFGGK